MIYLSVVMTLLIGFVSLGVDWGRVQVAKLELQRAVDAAARYAALGLDNDAATATANAMAVASSNTVDGTPLVLNAGTDIVYGTWNSTGRTFTPVAPGRENTANAIKISSERSAARGNAIFLMFASIIGRDNCDIHSSSIAMITHDASATNTVPGSCNPWLAGEPRGTVANSGNPHNNPDYAGTATNSLQSPYLVSGIALTAGHSLTFDSVSGGTNNQSSSSVYTPDGNPNWTLSNLNGAELGKSNVTAPINAVMGVFLNDNDPALTAPPSTNLDFSTPQRRNFITLSPQLKQVFFIGDGRKDSGELQQFVVPAGATRLYIANMDGYEWNNNIGSFTVTVHRLGTVTTVK